MNYVQLDDSNCIVIVEPRLNGDDVRITVTNVDDLCAQLKAAQILQRVDDEVREAMTTRDGSTRASWGTLVYDDTAVPDEALNHFAGGT